MTQRLPRREWPGGLGACGQFGASSPTDGSVVRARLSADGSDFLASAGWSGVGPVRLTAYVDSLPEADSSPGEPLQFGPLEEGEHDVDLFPWRVGWQGPPQLAPDLNGGRAYLTWGRVSGATEYRLYWDEDGQQPDPDQLASTFDQRRFGPVRGLAASSGSGRLDADGAWEGGDSAVTVTADGVRWHWGGFSGAANGSWSAAGLQRLRLSPGASGSWSFRAGPPDRGVSPPVGSGTRQFAVSAVVSGVEGPRSSGSAATFGLPTQASVEWVSGLSFGWANGPAAAYGIGDELWPVATYSGTSGTATLPSGAYYLRGATFASGQFVAPREFNFQAFDLRFVPSGQPAVRTVAASGTAGSVSVWVGVNVSGNVLEPVAVWAHVGSSGSSGSGTSVAWSGSYGYPETVYRVDVAGSFSGTVWAGAAATYSGSGSPFPTADFRVDVPPQPAAPGGITVTAT